MTNPTPWWLAWPVGEVAAAILPLFANSEEQWEREARGCIVTWCKTGVYKYGIRDLNRSHPFRDPDARAVNEAMQVLVNAGLLVRGEHGDRTYIGLTRLGWQALQSNTVRRHLGLGDATPTA